jgi:hypothetical protein
MELAIDVAGWAGALLLLLSYALISNGYWRPEGRTYQLANAVGSFCLPANNAWHRAWPSMFVNGVWISIATVSLWRIGRNLIRPNSTNPSCLPAHDLVNQGRPGPCK